MEFKIEIIPSSEIAYIRQIGPYGANNLQTMEKLKNCAKSNHLLDDEAVIFGIAWDNPKKMKPENCRYDACLVISDNSCITNDCVNYGTITGGKYAVFAIKHTSEAVQKAWNEIFPDLLKQGYQIDDAKPIIERYAAKMLKNHICEICVPLY